MCVFLRELAAAGLVWPMVGEILSTVHAANQTAKSRRAKEDQEAVGEQDGVLFVMGLSQAAAARADQVPLASVTLRAPRRPRIKRDSTLAAAMFFDQRGIHILVVSLDPASSRHATLLGNLDDLPRRFADFSILDQRRFSADELSLALDHLDALRVGRLVVLLSPARSVVRAIELPASIAAASDPVSQAASLEILAESEAPSSPPWRRTLALLPSSSDPATSSTVSQSIGSLSTWPGQPTSDDLLLASFFDSGVQGGFINPVIALVGLSRTLDSLTQPLRQTPDSSLLIAHAFQSPGAIAAAAFGSGKTILRSARCDPNAEPNTAASADRFIRETAQAVNIAFSGALSDDPLIACIQAPSSTSQHLPADRIELPHWAQQWGLVLGALVVASSSVPAVRLNASLRPVEPVPIIPAYERLLKRLARPSVAAAVIAASILTIGLFPMAGAYARLKILESRAQASQLGSKLNDAEQRVGFYRLLREKRWPMSKLLADVSGSAPVGVEIESIDLSQGDLVQIRGYADNQDLAASFRENLSSTRVFSQLATPSVTSEGRRVKFQLSARVLSNAAVYDGPWAKDLDFTSQSLGQRLFGSDWSPAQSASAPTSSSSSKSSRNATSSHSSSRPSPSDSFEPPPPLTDAQLQSMNADAAMKEFATRRAAASKVSDPEIKQRLQDEAVRAQQRMNAARSQGGSR